MDETTFAPIATVQVVVRVSLAGGTNGVSLNNFATGVKVCPECAEPQ